MPQPLRARAPRLLLPLLAGALLLPRELEGQTLVGQIPWSFGMRSGFGWAATLPDAMLGFGGFHIFEGTRWGLLAEGKLPLESNKRSPDYQGDLSLQEVLEDFPPEGRISLGSKDEWRLLNLAVIRAISAQAAFYLGGGLAQKSVVWEFGDDREPPFTRTGFYFVQDDEASGWEPNLIFGVLLRGGERIGFTTGFDLAPAALTLGIYYVFR